jgi:hypothetical protein
MLPFVDRVPELARLQRVTGRRPPGLVVLYGRHAQALASRRTDLVVATAQELLARQG